MDPNLLILETVYLKIKDRSYAINLNEYESIGTHWIALYVNDMQHTFRAEHIPKEIKNFIGNRNITANIFRIRAYGSIMCEYFSIGLIDFMLKDNDGKTILKYFQ